MVFPAFNGPATDTPEGEAGDGFVLSRGYTIVRVGWEFDIRREGAVRIDVPVAAGVTGVVRATFIPNSRADATVGDLVGYTPSDPASAQNTLRVRTALGAEFVTVPRAKWQLKGNTVTLEGGFEPGQTYELSYLAANPPVAGLGFAAVRDAATWVKYAPDATVSAKYTFAYGSSQTGRWLRDFVYEGFNTDERNRQAFDAVMPHIGGAGGIDLDRRWSTPTSLSMETVTRYPFSDRKQRDPVTGVEEGLLENARATEHQPKIFYTNSATEYWQRGFALAHTTPDGSKDVAPPDNVRMYSFSGASHNIGRFPPGCGQRPAAGQSVRLPVAAAGAPRRDGEMGARRRRASTEPLSAAPGRNARARRRGGVAEHSRSHIAANLHRRRSRRESPAARGREAAARRCPTWFRRSIATETSLAAFVFRK